MSSNGAVAAGRGKRARRVGVGIADQLLYSASNFGMTVLVARSNSVRDFGIYSLVLASYLIFNVTVRGLTSETLVIRFTAKEGRTWRRAASASSGAALALGVLAGVVFAGVGFFQSGSLADSLFILGASLPGLTLQDCLRYLALSRGKPQLALANDAAQVFLQFAAAGALIYFDHASTPNLIAAWGGSAYVGAAVGAVALRIKPRVFATWDWLRDNRDLALRYAADDLGAQLGQNGINYVLAGVDGLTGPAALRGAQTVFGPPGIFNLGVQTAIMPELVRSLRRSSRSMARMALGVGVALGAFGGVWGLLAMISPESLGKFLFGPTWPLVEPLLIYFLLAQVVAGLRMTPTIGLRALGAADRTVFVRVLAIALQLAFQLAGGLIDGVRGVAISKVIVGPIWTGITWWQYRNALADHRRERGAMRAHQDWDALVESVPESGLNPMAVRWATYD